MELYRHVSYQLAEQLTKRYSTSFSLSSTLFSTEIRQHIYAIYGLVRIADEVVDTYRGGDARSYLDELEQSTYAAIEAHYSTNPIVFAFSETARKYGVDRSLIAPFFDSMRSDLTAKEFDESSYATYIYGSAEVVGLMCLKVFTDGDPTLYRELESGARHLGAAYQKINFLRDIRADHDELGRVYFPGLSYDDFNDASKQAIVKDIRHDLHEASVAVTGLPKSSRCAVRMSYTYYRQLLEKLARSSAEEIRTKRIRLPASRKLWLYLRERLRLTR